MASSAHPESAFHRIKGRVLHALGWATADRRVEAEGAAELQKGRQPTEHEVERTEDDVKAEYGETPDSSHEPRQG